MAELGLFEIGQQAQLGAPPASPPTGGTGGTVVSHHPFPVPVQTVKWSQSFTFTGDVDKTVEVIVPNPVTVGNVLIVAVGGTSPEPGGIANPSVTDTLGNTYTQAAWIDGAGNDRNPVGIFFSNITAGGADTVSFTATLAYEFGSTTAPLSVIVAEYTSFGSPLVIQTADSATIVNGIPTITIADSTGRSLLTRGRNAAFNSFAVVDFIPTDLIVAAQCSAGGAAETVLPTSLRIRYRTVETDSLTHLGFYIGREISGRPQVNLIT